MTTTIRTYSELSKLKTFKERYNYLKIGGRVGDETFGFDRWMNQLLYKTKEWGAVRDYVITRDLGCDLGVKGYDIHDSIYVHHMNPISVDDILNRLDYVLNPEYLICTRFITHQAIHYGDESLLLDGPIERSPNDTCPWRH